MNDKEVKEYLAKRWLMSGGVDNIPAFTLPKKQVAKQRVHNLKWVNSLYLNNAEVKPENITPKEIKPRIPKHKYRHLDLHLADEALGLDIELTRLLSMTSSGKLIDTLRVRYNNDDLSVDDILMRDECYTLSNDLEALHIALSKTIKTIFNICKYTKPAIYDYYSNYKLIKEIEYNEAEERYSLFEDMQNVINLKQREALINDIKKRQ